MNEERYKQIKDSIELQSLVKAQIGVEDELLQEEIELLKAYEKLQQENKILKEKQKEFINYLENNWEKTQDIWYIKILQKYKEIIGGKHE